MGGSGGQAGLVLARPMHNAIMHGILIELMILLIGPGI